METRTVPVEDKRADPFYRTVEHRVWSAAVIRRADGQCQAIEYGQRCRKAQPEHRMYADHIIEIKDGGAAFAPSNGQCLCGRHHSLKTAQARTARLAR